VSQPGSLRRLGGFILAAGVALAGVAAGGAPARPNIILILADDMGFSDAGCYGGEIRTPNLDRLAAGGLRFSHFYNCALCGPSRAALMTGLYPQQAGVTSWTGLLNNRCVTVFELLKGAGYATCAVGRLDTVTAENWHDPAMIARFVDRFLGSTGHTGPGNYFKAVRGGDFFRDGKPYTLPAEGAYKTDLITDFAVQFIAEAASRPQPFFLYVAHYAPHWPLHAKPEDMARYRELYRKLGWDEARARRYQRLVELGLISAKCQLSPRDGRVPAWEGAEHKDWEVERMAAYAAQVDCLDQSVGRIREALGGTRAETNTLVLFLSDNGASDQPMTSELDQPGQTWRLDGTRTRVGNEPSIMPGPADTFVTAGPAWANVANTPFRAHKNTNYEGGIATPLIAWWPGVIKQAGAVTPEVGHIADIMATCLEAAGVTYPAQFKGRDVLALAGKSLLPVFQGGERDGHKTLCWATGGSRAIRMGNWKLVAAPSGGWELYDLAVDRTETHNVAAGHADVVKELAARWQVWDSAARGERGEDGKAQQ
jgi:arylsulfatase A-like enzyme